MLLLKQPRGKVAWITLRFDKEGVGKGDVGVKVLKTKIKGKVVGYSINQESVDLNAYLYAEKGYLASIAEELGKKGL